MEKTPNENEQDPFVRYVLDVEATRTAAINKIKAELRYLPKQTGINDLARSVGFPKHARLHREKGLQLWESDKKTGVDHREEIFKELTMAIMLSPAEDINWQVRSDFNCYVVEEIEGFRDLFMANILGDEHGNHDWDRFIGSWNYIKKLHEEVSLPKRSGYCHWADCDLYNLASRYQQTHVFLEKLGEETSKDAVNELTQWATELHGKLGKIYKIIETLAVNDKYWAKDWSEYCA